MKYSRPLLITAGLAAALLFGFLGEGGCRHCAITFCAALILAPLIALAGLAALIFREKQWLWEAFRLQIGLVLALALSLGIGLGTHRVKEAQAEAYVDAALPVLDAYKERHGHFPETLAEAGLPPPPARLTDAYHTNGDAFDFTYSNPSDFFKIRSFKHPERRWEEWD